MLADIIRHAILQDGPMDIGDFMALALGHPDHGYYMNRDPFGEAGDFTTAPEVSQMFGELIGAWAADIWNKLGEPKAFVLAEAGPGRGTLMADALRATARLTSFQAAKSVHLLETSPVLREKQASNLSPGTSWHADTKSFVKAGEGPLILIANEFLDALPVRQLQLEKNNWQQRMIGLDESGKFSIILHPADPTLIAQIPAYLTGTARQGDVFEAAPERSRFMTLLCDALTVRGGTALIIDYGHASPGLGDSLQAMKNHGFVPVLDDPGNADITAHVDFSALAEIARNAGCRVYGPIGQGVFLETLGIRQRAEILTAKADEKQAVDINTALQRLTASGQMGTLFKVMAVAAGNFEPAGF
jgi:NADH dehydrogenase [ubiquinone] 1 alpha subcomplex assembly factor 7